MIFDSKWLTLGAAIAAFILGFSSASVLADRDKQKREKEHLSALLKQEQEYGQRLKAREAEAAETYSAMLSRFRESRNLSLLQSADRLREQLDAAVGQVPGQSANPSGTCEKRLARCADVLGEGVSLLAEGAGLSERIAIRKDAISGLKK
jgi:hypothetical protein